MTYNTYIDKLHSIYESAFLTYELETMNEEAATKEAATEADPAQKAQITGKVDGIKSKVAAAGKAIVIVIAKLISVITSIFERIIGGIKNLQGDKLKVTAQKEYIIPYSLTYDYEFIRKGSLYVFDTDAATKFDVDEEKSQTVRKGELVDLGKIKTTAERYKADVRKLDDIYKKSQASGKIETEKLNRIKEVLTNLNKRAVALKNFHNEMVKDVPVVESVNVDEIIVISSNYLTV